MRVRHAAEADYDAVARLFAELGEDAALMTPERWRDELLGQALLVERDGAIVAYAVTSPLRDIGFVRYMAVDPAHRRRGVARFLMGGIAQRFRDAGCARWCLHVRPANEPAIRLYERAGMRHQHDVVDLHVDRAIAQRLPPADAPATLFEPADDDDIEAALELPRGIFAMLRASPQRIFRVAKRAATIAGAAMFDPTLKLSFPFRATDSRAARALIEAMLPHPDAQTETIMLAIEDGALVAELRAAGATIDSTSLHMAGLL